MSRPVAVLALTMVSGCVYYNAMWNANRLSNEARHLERDGRTAEARQRWAQAGLRAESVYVRHPESRWADDALLLHGRALHAIGDCAHAVSPLARADREGEGETLREEARLLLADCRVRLGEWAQAESLLVALAESGDRGRASRARLLLGRLVVARGDPAGGLEILARSNEPDALHERTRVWLTLGDAARAAALADSLARRPFREEQWSPLLDGLAAGAGPASASALVDRLAARREEIPSGARGRLLVADGDRWLATGDTVRARARWEAAAEAAPDSVPGGAGRVALIRLELRRVAAPAALVPIQRELARAAPAGGAPGVEAARLARAVELVLREPEDAVAGIVRAEVARDSLKAPVLAATLFRRVAERWPESLFAPKALIAAAAEPDGEGGADLLAQVRQRYPQSPYVRALAGEADPAYSVAEDSLRVALGLSGGMGPAASRLVNPPGLGPRTVLELEDMPIDANVREARPRPATPDRRVRVVNERN